MSSTETIPSRVRTTPGHGRISNDTHPFHGEQYIVLGLTTKSWHDGLIGIDDKSWLDGGTPEPSRIIPWSVETLEHSDVDSGRAGWTRR